MKSSGSDPSKSMSTFARSAGKSHYITFKSLRKMRLSIQIITRVMPKVIICTYSVYFIENTCITLGASEGLAWSGPQWREFRKLSKNWAEWLSESEKQILIIKKKNIQPILKVALKFENHWQGMPGNQYGSLATGKTVVKQLTTHMSSKGQARDA